MAQWFLVQDEKEQGPFDDAQLRKLAAEGKLNASDVVRRNDSQTGVPAKKIKGLFAQPASDKAIGTKRPPPPPTRVEIGATTTSRTSMVSQAAPVVPSQNGVPPLASVPQKRRLNPNITFILGIWVAIGLCAVAFTFLAITGRLAPLVAWLESAKQKAGQDSKSSDAKRSSTKQTSPKQAPTSTKPPMAVKIVHEWFTQVIMPDLPPDRIIDSTNEGPHEKVTNPVPVDDVEKVDFLHGSDGEPIQMVKYDRTFPQHGYFYRNKSGKCVSHGPWFTFHGKQLTDYTVYVHGAMKLRSSWENDGRPTSLEIFKSDADHRQTNFQYWDDGSEKSITSYCKVNYIKEINENGFVSHTIDRVLHGHCFAYFDNRLVIKNNLADEIGEVQAHHEYNNGTLVGAIMYNRKGSIVSSLGTLKTMK